MTAISRLLVVGLGNAPFPLTRHSVGHCILDSLASRFGVSFSADKSLKGFAVRTDMTIGDSSVDLMLYKPKALMNVTGACVSSALKGTGIQPSSMVVVHDSLSHKPGTISPKFGGSANGHNGVRSLISALGDNKDFHRLRIGIGRIDGDVTNYVLGDLSSYEREFWSSDGQGTDLVLKALAKIAGTVLHSR